MKILFLGKIFVHIVTTNSIVTKYSHDNKLINMIIGIQTHSATFFCAYAEYFRGPDGQIVLGRIRTVENCRENAREYEQFKIVKGDKRKKLKNFKNNEYLPLFEPLEGLEDGVETKIWTKIPFPGLHTVLLGPTNDIVDALTEYDNDSDCIWKAFSEDEVKKVGQKVADEYMKKVSIQRSQYFSKKLEGNECKKFIKEKNVKILNKIMKAENIPKEI